MSIAISEETTTELKNYLKARKKIYETICKKLGKKYGSLAQLENKIEKKGVPENDHTEWDDLIEWTNALSELKKINKIMEGLNVIF